MSHRLLLVIDPQIDFITGSLPVPGAESAMEALASYIIANKGKYTRKIITADRHPYDHFSFEDVGGQWPRHCVHDTVGAAIWPSVFSALYSTDGPCLILHKGEKKHKEEYSIFENISAAKEISEIVAADDIRHIDICGLAGDICVLESLRQGIILLPHVKFNVITSFSPSIDGGHKLNDFIASHNL